MGRGDHRCLHVIVAGVAALSVWIIAAAARAVCVGDCNANGIVAISEAQRCVNLVNNIPGEPCANADQAGDGIDADDVDACIQSFLDAATCPMVFTPVATATLSPAPVATNTPAPTNTAVATNTPPFTSTPVPTNTIPPPPTDTPPPPRTATNTMPAPIGSHACMLASGSQVNLFGGALTTVLPATGGVNISCGAEGANGTAPCSCTVQPPGFGQLNVPGVGFACVKPSTGSCLAGEVDCDGGNNLGLDIDGFVDINNNDANPIDGIADQTAPCTGNADCAADCATRCGGAGNVFNSGCAGFCSAGTEAACTLDADCLPNNGACNGQNGVPSGNTCECTCVDDAVGPAAPAGGLSCQLAFSLTVEQLAGAPCDSVGILINLGNTCAPLTTETVTAIINNANDGGNTLPAAGNFTSSGVEISCAALAGSTTSGIKLVGAALFYGSTIGDLTAGLTVNCQ